MTNTMQQALEAAGVINETQTNAKPEPALNTYAAFEQAADNNLQNANGFKSGRQRVCSVIAAIVHNGLPSDKLSLGAAVKRSTKENQSGKWSMYSKEYGAITKLVTNLQAGVEVKDKSGLVYTLPAIEAGTQHFGSTIPTGTIAAKRDDEMSKARKTLGISKAEQTKMGLTDADVKAQAAVKDASEERAAMLADIPAIVKSVTNGLHFLKTENPAEFQKVLAIFASDLKKAAKQAEAA